MQNIIPDIIPVIATLLGGVLALAGVWITQKATRSNRVWELRKENYTIILKRLKEASERAAIVDDGYNSGEYGLGPHDYFNSPDRTEQEKAAYNTWKSCRETFDANCFILLRQVPCSFRTVVEVTAHGIRFLLPT